MRRLLSHMWVQLSIAFGFVTLVGVAIVTGTGVALNNTIISDAILEDYQLPDTFFENLSRYYRQNGRWAGVFSLLIQQDARLPRVPGGGFVLIFADEQGEIIYDAFTDSAGTMLTESERQKALSIQQNGRTIAFVLLKRITQPLPASNIQAVFQQRINSTLFVLASFIAVSSIIVGGVASRNVTAPLSKLAQTVRAFGKDLGKRAAIQGSIEVMEVATAFNDMAQALQDAEKHRRSMVADIAHELRTPLTVLKSNLQAILDGVYPMNTDEISGLMTQTELLSRLVNDLHVLAQADAKQLHLDLERVDLGVLLTRAVQSFRSMIESHELKLTMNVPSTAAIEDELLIEADVNRLEQIINNLLNNAVTHTPPGGEISINLWHDAEKVYFSIADTGNGIPAKHLPHIFDRFYRADRSRSRATGGAGLGLAIVRAIVEMHNGSVRVMSEGIPGQGAVFIVEFPRACVSELPHNV